MKGTHFDNMEHIQMCIRQHINSATEQIQECFEVWKKIMEKCIAATQQQLCKGQSLNPVIFQFINILYS